MADDSALARELAQFREDLREDLTEIKADLGKLLPREVYDLRDKQIEGRLDALERDRKAAAEQRSSDRRWLMGVVVVPVILTLVQIWLSMRGAG